MADAWVLKALLAGAVGVFAGAGAYTFRYAEGASYMSDDPRACINCHVMREHFDGWQKGAHHAHATCNDCHVPHALIPKYIAKAEHGWRHSKAFTLGGFAEPIRITPEDLLIVRGNCLRCHAQLTDAIAGHGDGSSGREPTDCIHCHSAAGHGPRR